MPDQSYRVAMRSGPEQLRDWMRRREFINEEASRYLGLDASVVTKLANGSRNAGLRIAIRIERLTGIPVEAWVSDDADDLVSANSANPRKCLQDK